MLCFTLMPVINNTNMYLTVLKILRITLNFKNISEIIQNFKNVHKFIRSSTILKEIVGCCCYFLDVKI